MRILEAVLAGDAGRCELTLLMVRRRIHQLEELRLGERLVLEILAAATRQAGPALQLEQLYFAAALLEASSTWYRER